MRGVSKLLLATALAALLATGVGACGGDDSDDSTADSGTTATQTTGPSTTPDDRGDKAPGANEPGDDSGPSGGGGSAGFRTPGGDNSIPDYGNEATGAEFEEASDAVVGFLRARAKDDWGTVCSYMAVAALKPIENIASRASQSEVEGCPELLTTLTADAPASSRPSTIGDGIDSLRAEGMRGFALYHGTDGADYFVPLVKEDGEWKVGTLAPTAFP